MIDPIIRASEPRATHVSSPRRAKSRLTTQGRRMQRQSIVLGTATPGGGFPVYGEAFAEAVNAADASLVIETRNTKGSTENVPLLRAGSIDIALVQGEVANPALADASSGLRI